MENIFLNSVNDYKLSLAVFRAEKAKAVVQIIHGMQEHKERYYAFAEFLVKNGYSVVVSDMRGHGKDAPILGHIADKKGEQLIIEDYKNIYQYIKENFQDLPVYLLGHSMGSIISRVLLQTNSKDYSKVILSGYVNPNPISGVAVALGNMVGFFRGKKKSSKLLASLALGPYTKAVKDRKTVLDWLSYNEDNVNKYIENPLCGFPFSNGSFSSLFHLLNYMGKAKRYKDVNKELPILLAGGEEDPCTGGEKGRAASKALLEKVGFNNVSVITYQKMRHEILNEIDNQKVYQDMLDFFNK